MKNNFISKAITETLEHRKRFLEVIFTVAVLSTGINLSCIYFTAPKDQQPTAILCLGLTLTLLPLIHIFLNLCFHRKREALIEAAFCLDNQNNEAKKILGYKFSTDLCSILQAGFIENPAWQRLWNDHPIIQITPTSKSYENVVSIAPHKSDDAKLIQMTEVSTSYKPIPRSAILMVEGIEFMILATLSIHLSDHFKRVNPDKASDLIYEFKRTDFSKLLMDNRFLGLFSTPLENRPIFSNVPNISQTSNLTEIRGVNGERYTNFKLKLPKETVVERPKHGCLQLTNSRFKLKIEVIYEGYDFNLPDGFEQAYIGLAPNAISTKKIKLKITNEIYLKSLFSFKNWQYYSWLDSFVEELYSQFSFEEFIKQINWSTVSTLLHTQQTLKKFITDQNKN